MRGRAAPPHPGIYRVSPPPGKLDCQGKDFMARMCDSFYTKVILSQKVNFLKRFFGNVCLQREFVIQDFYLPRQEKYPEKVI